MSELRKARLVNIGGGQEQWKCSVFSVGQFTQLRSAGCPCQESCHWQTAVWNITILMQGAIFAKVFLLCGSFIQFIGMNLGQVIINIWIRTKKSMICILLAITIPRPARVPCPLPPAAQLTSALVLTFISIRKHSLKVHFDNPTKCNSAQHCIKLPYLTFCTFTL